MVDIVSHATVAAESDAVLKRHQDSSSASSKSSTIKNTPSDPRAVTPAAAGSPVMTSDVRLEIIENKSIDSFIYKLIDKKSGEVIRQWPTEQMISMREYFAKQLAHLVDEKA